jgi:DNA invertase Pin-like site-specific DNA recombinase
MKAAIYARFSTDKQSVASLEDQERLCRALADRQGWEVVGIYKDAAMRGTRKDRRGYLALTTDALAGKFQIVVAESLDRLNRDLEETARLYKRLKFVDVGIVTVSEGPISEIHVSITGLMGEMYVKNLGEKTRRGVEGRVLAGKSGGGRCFGYDVVGGVDANGEPITGERRINEAEGEIVREIHRRFAAGEGPRTIARALNGRGVPGPYGRPWGDTTIRGHAKKGTGILNNELYRGRLVWGRQRFIKDPATGRRVSRLNPADSEVVTEVPHLRIVDDELWEAVKHRQAEVSRPLSDPHTTRPLNDLHRPRFLLSGLLTCGVCAGGYTITAKDRYGCARRARQGTCTNSRGIKRQELERRVLDGLRASLVTPDLVAEFVAEYQAEWNRLQGERRVAAGQRDRRLADVKRRLAGIVAAIERGIITPTTKARLEALEAEKGQLESAPVESPLPAIHPNLAQLYRDKIARLEVELADPEIAAETKSVLRSLINTIKITPGTRRGNVELELHGELASILAMAQGNRSKNGTPVSRIQVSVVAGACITRYRIDGIPPLEKITFRLAP